MPLYQVHHSYPFTEAQKEDLAKRITYIHTRLFTVPAAFVNVSFMPYQGVSHFVGGIPKTGHFNIIAGNVRWGPARTMDQAETLCRQLEEAWNAVVISKEGGDVASLPKVATIDNVWLSSGLLAALEGGFMIPGAGGDYAWIKEHLQEFQKLADNGNDVFQEMLDELKTRDEFKGVFENKDA